MAKSNQDVSLIEDIQIDSKFVHEHNFISNPIIIDDISLYQLGEIYCDNNAVVAPHIHDDFFELSYIISGTGMFLIDDTRIVVSEGDCILSLPFERHEIISDTFDSLRFFYTAFSFKKDSNYREIMYNNMLNLEPKSRIHKFTDGSGEYLFTNLLSTFENESQYSLLRFKLGIYSLCLDLYNIFIVQSQKNYSSPRVDNEQELYYKIIKYIDNNLLTIKSLTEISTHLNHNYSYLSRIFKAKFGQSIHSYFSNKKLNMAKKLIESDKMSLSEISKYLNYASIYAFSRAFKSEFGMSPKAYKDSVLKNE